MKNDITTADPLQKFLQVYRRTPCPSSPRGRSPAENFIGRQIRTALTTSRSNPEERNKKMEEQFNRHNNAHSKKFRPGDAVWVRDYRKDQAKWVYGEVTQRIGNVLYEVLVNGQIHRRHANQLRPRTAEDTEQNLLDLFDLPTECQRHPTKAVSIPTPTPGTSLTRLTESDGNDPSTATSTSRPLRRSTRQRRAPTPLNMDPSRKTYLGV
ncbi:hypothetical protein ANCDUO_23294 [Ancylostoma duodenale]|uniref:Integrase catalytic domain-containing protein n=1 Tax=Ancylostoma duodenale TaxID=51022 RepID=A0A0C2FDN1_9BILA|nr:hypothetical protein ANCDUO_23294 [Ancylostoma duodenale]